MTEPTVRLQDKKLFLFDMDGTLYLGDRLIPGAAELLSYIRETGRRYLFVTNNSSRSRSDYVKKLERLGIPATEENFYTSTDATILYLKEHHPDVAFYAMGTRSFIAQLQAEGIRVVPEEDADGVLIANDTELTFDKLAAVCRLLHRDIPYIATNPDTVCPTADGSVPDCGSFAEMLEHATGKMPVVIGKPQPAMLLCAAEYAGVPVADGLMIGDRLYTDIASGVNAGMDTVFVLSGEGTAEQLASSPYRPTCVMQDVGELLHRLRG